jgi:hypothetical protein
VFSTTAGISISGITCPAVATDVLSAFLFTLGWLAALWRVREPRCRFLLIWFGVMLLPTVLSVEAPHSLRGSGALPPFALLCGLGAGSLIGIFSRTSLRRAVGPLLLLAVLVISGGLTARDYFARWAQSARLGVTFSAPEQLAAQAAARHVASGLANTDILISDRLFSQPQMVYALGLLPQASLGPGAAIASTGQVRFILEDHFDPRQPMFLLSRDNQGATAIPLEPLSAADAGKLQERFGQNDRVTPLAWPGQQPGWTTVYEGPLSSTTPLRTRQISHPLAVSFDLGVQLLGYDVEPAPPDPDTQLPRVRLTLFWRVIDHERRLLNEWGFMHLANDEGVWRTENRPLPERHLFHWLRAERELQDMRLVPIPAEMPSGKAFFEVGLYQADLANPKNAGPRVGIVDGEGRVVADQVNLAAIAIRSDPPQADSDGLRPLTATFDNRISLLGWSAEPDEKDATRLRVNLLWRAERRSTTDYTAFVHLIDGNGEILSQSDPPPGGEQNPTTKWAPGETVRTTTALTRAPGADRQALRLRVGLYEPVSGKQLPLTGRGAEGQETFLLLPLAQQP